MANPDGPEPPRPADFLQRIDAALAYVGLNRESGASAMGTSKPTLLRALGGTTGSEISRGQVLALADIADLPAEFFYADFSRLAEITPPNAPALSPSARLDANLEQAAQRTRAREQADERTRPAQPEGGQAP